MKRVLALLVLTVMMIAVGYAVNITVNESVENETVSEINEAWVVVENQTLTVYVLTNGSANSSDNVAFVGDGFTVIEVVENSSSEVAQEPQQPIEPIALPISESNESNESIEALETNSSVEVNQIESFNETVGLNQSNETSVAEQVVVDDTVATEVVESLSDSNESVNVTVESNETFNVTITETVLDATNTSNESAVPVSIEAIAAAHLDSEGSLVEDVYELVNETDDVWTSAIPQGHMVRVTFETKLTNGSVIDLLARDNGSVSYAEIYIANTSHFVGRSGIANPAELQYIPLENMPYEADTFDVKVKKHYHDLSREICDEENPDCNASSMRENAIPGMLEFDFVHDAAVTATSAGGMVAYIETGIAAPRYRRWNRTTTAFGSELTNTISSQAVPTWVVARANHERDTTVMMTLDASSNTSAQIWNGSAWGSFQALATQTSSTSQRSIDFAIEDLSGDVLFVYEDVSSNDDLLAFRIFNGTAYGTQGTINHAQNSPIRWVKTVPRPGTDNIMVLGQTSNNNLVAILWNGTDMVTSTLILASTSLGVTNQQLFDFKWAGASGDGFVAYRSSGAPSTISYRNFSSATNTWSGEAVFVTLDGGALTGIRLCADPTSNHIGAVTQDGTNDANFWIWNGSALETNPARPAEDDSIEANGAGALNVDCAFMNNGSAIFVYVDRAASEDLAVRTCTYTKTEWSHASLPSCPLSPQISATGSSIETLELYKNPVTDEVMLLAFNLDEDLESARWTGSTWTNITTLETTLDCANGLTQCAMFDWDRFDPVPNVTLVSPANGTSFGASSVVTLVVDASDNINVSVVNATVSIPNGTRIQLNLTRTSGSAASGQYQVNFTSTATQGQYNVTVEARDGSTHDNRRLTDGFFTILSSAPSVTGATLVPTDPLAGNVVCLSVNVSDSDGVASVVATIDRPTDPDTTVVLLDTSTCNSVPNDGQYSNTYTVLEEGVHNWTRVNATDTLGSSNVSTVGLTFEAFANPGVGSRINPSNAAFHAGSRFNLSLINVSDNVRAVQDLLIGVDTFMYFNFTPNFTGTIADSNVTIEHQYRGSGAPTVSMEIFAQGSWQTLCALTVSSTDAVNVCDLDTFVNANASVVNNLQLRTRVTGVSNSTQQGVDNVFIVVQNVSADDPPVISSVAASAGNLSANITWTTNKQANSSVNYGTTQGLGTIVASASLVASHAVSLPGLINGTLYFYNVTSCDATNCTTNGPFNFTTKTFIEVEVRGVNDSLTNAAVEIRGEQDELEATIESNSRGLVAPGRKKLRIIPSQGRVKGVNLSSVVVAGSLSIRIDDTPEDAVPVPSISTSAGWEELYAIDLSGVNFTSGVVTVNATGQRLIKCASWNFTTRTCPGDWTFMQGVSPGQLYSFNVSPVDPGFGEINATAAEHLDENYTFVSDVFGDVNTTDGTFSESIPENHYVRVTFEQNLTNGSVIDIIARDNSTVAFVEIYIANTTQLVGRSGIANPVEAQFIELSNMTIETNVFDLKTVKLVHNLSNEVCDANNSDCNASSIAENNLSAFLEYDFIHDEAISSSGANGLISYAESAVNAPRYRLWNNTPDSFGSELTNTVSSEAPAEWIVVHGNHERNTFAMMVLDTSSNTSAQIWNGSAWGNFQGLATQTPNTAQRSIDFAIEDVSGDVLFVYENVSSADNFLAFRTFNGTNYGLPGQIDHGQNSPIRWVKAVPRPGTNNIMVMGHTSTNNLFAVLWNGTDIDQSTIINATTSLGITSQQVFDFEWSALSGNGFLAYRSSAAPSTISYRNFSSATNTWSSEATFFTLDSGGLTGIRLCADPQSNYIGAVTQDGTNDANFWIWNGSALETTPARPAEDANAEPSPTGAINLDCAFETQSGLGVFVYVPNAASDEASVRTCTYNKTAWSNASLIDCPLSPVISASTGSIENLELYTNPVTDELMLMAQNIDEDLDTARWNGSAYVNISTLETTLDCANGATQCVMFDWDRFDPVPNISVVTPANGTLFNSSAAVNITINASDNVAVANVTINVTLPNGQINQSRMTRVSGNVSSGLYFLNFTNTTQTGQYNFTAVAQDNSTHRNTKTVSGFFTIAEQVPPNISFVAPTPANESNLSQTFIPVNVTATDNVAIDTITIFLFNTTGLVQQNQSSTSPFFVNFTNLADGTYFINATANDTSGNTNRTETRTIRLDTTNPLVFDVRPVNNSVFNVTNTIEIAANVTNGFAVDTVLANVTFPNGTIQQLTLANVLGAKYNTSFTIPNNPGTFTVRFIANDTVGNINTTVTTQFNAMGFSALVVSVNQTIYPQGTAATPEENPDFGFKYFIPFQVNYSDSVSNVSITDGTCAATMNQSGTVTTLTFNATTGNYSGFLDTFREFGNNMITASCSSPTYQSNTNTTFAAVFFQTYLRDINRTFGGVGNNLTNESIMRSKVPPTGTGVNATFSFTLNPNSTVEVEKFYFCGSNLEQNCSFLRNYNFLGNVTARLNASVSQEGPCVLEFCARIEDSNLNPIGERCNNATTNITTEPQLLTQTGVANATLVQGQFNVFVVRCAAAANVTVPTPLNVTIFYDVAGSLPTTENTFAQPLELQSLIINATQQFANFTIGPNENLNFSLNYTLQINNTANNSLFAQVHLVMPVLAQFHPHFINGSNRVFNSSGQLFASDNPADNVSTLVVDDETETVSFTTETLPGLTVVNEIMDIDHQRALRNAETLDKNLTFRKTWNISVNSIFTSFVQITNVTVYTNYSAFLANDTEFEFFVNVTNSTGTFNVTNESVVNRTTMIITFPAQTVSTASLQGISTVNFTVVAQDVVPPSVFDLRPLQNTTFNTSATIEVAANVTDGIGVDAVLANISFPNGTVQQITLANAVGAKYNVSFTIPELFGQYNVTFIANDTAGNVNNTETTFFVGVDQVPPSVFALVPTANSTFNITRTIEIAANVTDVGFVNTVLANVSFPNGTAQIVTLALANGSKYNASFTIPALLGRYNITFFANDSLGTINNTETTFFNAVDQIPPSVFDVRPVSGSLFAGNETIEIAANVTDFSSIANVTANVSFPNGTNQVVILLNALGDKYNASFTVPSLFGRFNVTFFANDTFGNINNTETTFFNGTEAEPPSVFALLPVAGSNYNESNLIEIGANVTDNVAVDTVFANITFPNSTIQQLTLANAVGDKYNVSFTAPNRGGTYTVRFIANDTSGNVNASEQTTFNIINISVINASSFDADGDAVNLTLIVTNGTGDIVYSTTSTVFSFSLAAGLYNITQIPVNQSRLINLTIVNANVTTDFNLVGIDYPETGGFSSPALGLDPEVLDMSFDEILVFRNATNDQLYKCNQWNYSLMSCEAECNDGDEEAGLCEINSTWNRIANLTPGQIYNFTINATDPGFSEYTESDGENSTTSTAFVNKTVLTFTPTQAGRFMVIATAQLHGASTTSSVLARVLVDGVDRSNVTWEPKDSAIANDYQAYGTHLIEDFSASAHTIVLQWASEVGAATFIKNARISVVELSEVTNASNETETALNSTFQNITNITVNPSATDDYLIIASAEILDGACGQTVIGRMLINETQRGNLTYECVDTTDYKPFFTHDVVNLSAGIPHNITIDARRTNNGGEIRRARVSAIRLTPDFDVHHAKNDTVGTVSCAGTCTSAFVNQTVLTFTPPETADYLFIATAQFNSGAGADQSLINLTIDGEVACDVIQERTNGAPPNELQFICQRNVTLNASPHTAVISFAAQGGGPTTTINNARITAIRITPDNTPPSVFALIPVANSTFNVSDTIEIGANVTDALGVANVTVNITFPNGTVQQLSLANAVGDKYNASFIIPALLGVYNVTFIANDSAGNVNSTETTFFVGNDTQNPSVVVIAPAAGTSFGVGSTIAITANVTDNLSVASVRANVSFPNGTVELVNLTNIGGATYSGNFSIPLLIGQYNVSFFANDTVGNINNSETTFFFAVAGVPNVSIAKADSIDPVGTGQLLTYIITVNNSGNGTAFNATVQDSLPAQVTFVNATPTPDSGTNTTFSLGNISSNSTTQINITVNVSSNLFNGTTINNSVNVSSQNITGGVFIANASELTTVINNQTPNVTITKTDSPDPVTVGATLTYTITVINNGPGTAFNATVQDVVPSEVTFVSANPAPDAGTNSTFTLGNMSSGASTTITVTTTVLANTTVGTVINNTANVTFLNGTFGSFTFNASANTTVQAVPPQPAGGGGGGGGGGGQNAIICPTYCDDPRYARTTACLRCANTTQTAPAPVFPQFPVPSVVAPVEEKTVEEVIVREPVKEEPQVELPIEPQEARQGSTQDGLSLGFAILLMVLAALVGCGVGYVGAAHQMHPRQKLRYREKFIVEKEYLTWNHLDNEYDVSYTDLTQICHDIWLLEQHGHPVSLAYKIKMGAHNHKLSQFEIKEGGPEGI